MNVYDSGIVRSAKDSIDRLQKLNVYDETTLDKISADPDLPDNIKKVLLETSRDPYVQPILGVTFQDVLGLVYPLLLTTSEPQEAKKIFITEVTDSIEKSYYGKIIRVLNSLTGLHPAVNITYSTV